MYSKLLIASAVAALAGCASNPLPQAFAEFQAGVTSNTSPQPVNVAPIVLKVPNDPGIKTRQPAPYSTVIARDIGFDSRSLTVSPNAKYHRVLNELLTPSSFVIHARTDNGVAGSGIKYLVNYDVQESPQGYQVKFTPQSRTSYQTGLIGKFPLPDFDEPQLRSYLTSLQLVYRFEIDSPFNSESVMSNFLRLAKPKVHSQGWADPITGKSYGRYFISEVRGKSFQYVVEVYPYRNGSKVVISAIVPGVETSAQTVDFAILINEARQTLESIAKS
jgi:hypothetical protein